MARSATGLWGARSARQAAVQIDAPMVVKDRFAGCCGQDRDGPLGVRASSYLLPPEEVGPWRSLQLRADARFQVDAACWPRTAAFVERVLKLDSFEKLKPIEERLRRTPLAQHRTVLREMGVPVTQETYGTTEPRHGVMRID